MKRLFCLLLILCFLPAFAVAFDPDFFSFCGYAYSIGNIDFDDSQKSVADDMTVYQTKTGYVGFRYASDVLQSISVYGTGDELLIYAFAAICTVEGSASNINDNFSVFLRHYFQAHAGGEQIGTTKGGCVFSVRPYENGYMFVINR